MIASIMQDTLEVALGMASRVVSSKPEISILEGVLLTIKDKTATVVGSNVQTTVSVSVPAGVSREGSVVLPAKTLSDIVSSFPLERIDLSLDGLTLKMKTSKTKASVKGLSSVEFPVMKDSVPVKSVLVDENALSAGLFSVLNFVSREDTRPFLSGVLFRFEKDNLCIVGSDGYRVSMFDIGMPGMEPMEDAIVPLQAVTFLHRNMSLGGNELAIDIPDWKDSKHITFRDPAFTLTSLTIDGTYVQVRRALPKTWSTEVTVNQQILVEAIQSTSVFSSDNDNAMRLIANPETQVMTIQGKSKERGDCEWELDCAIAGAAINMEMNTSYMMDALRVSGGGDVTLLMTNKQPFMVKSPDTRKTILLMPMVRDK